MTTKPFRSTFRTAVRQQIDDLTTFQVAENRAVSMPLAPGPVIDTQHPGSLSGRLYQLPAQLTKECRTTGQDAELLRQPRPCGSAQRARNLLQGSAQSARAPRVSLCGFRQAFGEYLLPTIFAVAKEPAHAQFDPHRNPFPGQITQPSPVTAVNAP